MIIIFLFHCHDSLLAAKRNAPPKEYVCDIYYLPLPPLPTGQVVFINGMNHRPERAVRCAETLSGMCGGYSIYVVYNPTLGFFRDLAKCFFELYHFEITPPVEKLHEEWDRFFRSHSAHHKLLQFCHSEGAIQVRNALLRYPPQLRKRIIVVAIAPAAYIPDCICCDAYHYVSRRDIVPNLDRKGRKWCAEKTIVLSPHRSAAFFDHYFLSPTFRPAIQHHLTHYLKTECR